MSKYETGLRFFLLLIACLLMAGTFVFFVSPPRIKLPHLAQKNSLTAQLAFRLKAIIEDPNKKNAPENRIFAVYLLFFLSKNNEKFKSEIASWAKKLIFNKSIDLEIRKALAICFQVQEDNKKIAKGGLSIIHYSIILKFLKKSPSLLDRLEPFINDGEVSKTIALGLYARYRLTGQKVNPVVQAKVDEISEAIKKETLDGDAMLYLLLKGKMDDYERLLLNKTGFVEIQLGLLSLQIFPESWPTQAKAKFTENIIEYWKKKEPKDPLLDMMTVQELSIPQTEALFEEVLRTGKPEQRLLAAIALLVLHPGDKKVMAVLKKETQMDKSIPLRALIRAAFGEDKAKKILFDYLKKEGNIQGLLSSFQFYLESEAVTGNKN